MQKTEVTYYTILQVHHHAPQKDIKQAYRKLVKQFHPDSNREIENHDAIARINVAYETLSNPQSRTFYDRSIGIIPLEEVTERTSAAEKHLRQRVAVQRREDDRVSEWIERVYEPILAILSTVLTDLDSEIDTLADDPFDDILMSNFLSFLEECRLQHRQAQQCFRRLPNPIATASIAEYLYHCLNQLGDSIEELRYFSCNFDDHHLHTGKELWRIAEEMYERAQQEMNCRCV